MLQDPGFRRQGRNLWGATLLQGVGPVVAFAHGSTHLGDMLVRPRARLAGMVSLRVHFGMPPGIEAMWPVVLVDAAIGVCAGTSTPSLGRSTNPIPPRRRSQGAGQAAAAKAAGKPAGGAETLRVCLQARAHRRWRSTRCLGWPRRTLSTTSF